MRHPLRPPNGCAVSQSFLCGAVVAGCPVVFVGVDDDDILRQVVDHAAAEHGIDALPPDIVTAVVAAVSPVPAYLADAFERLRGTSAALPAQRSPLEPEVLPLPLLAPAAARSADLMRQVFQDAPTAAAVTSADGTLERVNQALGELTRTSAAELVGTRLEGLVHPDDVARVRSVRGDLLAGLVRRAEIVVRLVRGDASTISVELACAPVLDGRRPSGQIIAHLQDVTDRRAEQERLTRAARTDPLTGLWNRAALFEQLELALDRRDRRHGTVTVLFWDIDDFKSVNDNHGHHVGDAVIVEYAGRLGGVKRTSDIAARFAGDEFVLVYENGPNLDTAALVDRLRHVLSRPFAVDGLQIGLTTSIGTAVAAREEITAAALLQRADQAMYSAKALRRRGALRRPSAAVR